MPGTDGTDFTHFTHLQLNDGKQLSAELVRNIIRPPFHRVVTLDALTKYNRPGRIYYIIPDIGRRRLDLKGFIKSLLKGKAQEHITHRWLAKPRPIGGVKVIYQHCLLLQEHGFDAIPVRVGRYEGNFYGYPIKTQSLEKVSTDLSPADIVVCPEITPSIANQFPGCQKVMFVQNWVHLYDHNGFSGEKIYGSYIENGFDRIMCCSDYLVGKLVHDSTKHVAVVNNFIDLNSFTRDDSKRVPGRVLALPRKNMGDLQRIMQILENDNIDFRLVDGLSQKELIKEYQEADIFLATGYPEGFGLPPLEAMACGAAVVGFTGGGAREFMIDGETALVAEDGDCEAAAAKLKQLLSDSDLRTQLRNTCYQVAQRYTKERTASELLAFYRSLSYSEYTPEHAHAHAN